MSNGITNGAFVRKDLFYLGAMLIMAGIIGWLVIEVSQMKGNRFTSGDGLAIWRALSEKADVDNVPPAWFRDDVQRLESRIRELEQKH